MVRVGLVGLVLAGTSFASPDNEVVVPQQNVVVKAEVSKTPTFWSELSTAYDYSVSQSDKTSSVNKNSSNHYEMLVRESKKVYQEVRQTLVVAYQCYLAKSVLKQLFDVLPYVISTLAFGVVVAGSKEGNRNLK